MAQQTRIFATFANDASVGTVAWATPGNAAASENTRTTATITIGSQQSQYLKATNSAYSTGDNTLAAGARINFIDYNVEQIKSGNPAANIRDFHLYPVEGGSLNTVADYANTASDWSTAESVVAHTQNTNLPSAATILASNWGFALAVLNQNGTGGGVAEVDWLYATIDFTPAGPPNPVGSFVRQAVNRAANFCFFRAWKPLPRLVYRPRIRPVHFLFSQPLSWRLAA